MGFWVMFKDAIYYVIDWLYQRSGDWGMAIILITILFRILILPISIKQNQSATAMQAIQPKMKEIQTKYADDQIRQREELTKLYSEANYNPLSGCLPMLLQMPIFMALFQVLRELPKLITQSGYSEDILPATFYNIVPDLSVSVSQVFAFSLEGVVASIPYVIMLLLFSILTVLPTLMNPSIDSSQKISMGMMSLLFLFIGWNTPAGVLLYYDISSFIGMGQNFIMKEFNKRKEKIIEEEKIDVTPVKVEVERREKKSRPRKAK